MEVDDFFFFNSTDDQENDELMKKYCDSDMLYHYTKLETGIEKILPTGLLRFSSFVNVNDPSERKKRNISINWGNDSGMNFDDAKKLDYLALLNDIRLNKSKLICFSKNRENAYEYITEKEEPGNIYRTGFYKPRMWTQYGDNHRGICIAIHKQKLVDNLSSNFTQNRVYRGDIKYTDSTKGIFSSTALEVTKDNIRDFQSNFNKFFIEHHIIKHRERLYFTKSTDWRDEQEYRFLIISEDNEDYFIDIKNSIEGIFLGIDFPSVYLHSLSKLIPQSVNIFKLNLNDSIPEIIKIDRTLYNT